MTAPKGAAAEVLRPHDPRIDKPTPRLMPVMQTVYFCSCGWTSHSVATAAEIAEAFGGESS